MIANMNMNNEPRFEVVEMKNKTKMKTEKNKRHHGPTPPYSAHSGNCTARPTPLFTLPRAVSTDPPLSRGPASPAGPRSLTRFASLSAGARSAALTSGARIPGCSSPRRYRNELKLRCWAVAIWGDSDFAAKSATTRFGRTPGTYPDSPLGHKSQRRALEPPWRKSAAVAWREREAGAEIVCQRRCPLQPSFPSTTSSSSAGHPSSSASAGEHSSPWPWSPSGGCAAPPLHHVRWTAPEPRPLARSGGESRPGTSVTPVPPLGMPPRCALLPLAVAPAGRVPTRMAGVRREKKGRDRWILNRRPDRIVRTDQPGGVVRLI
jgi:hypothetical protein